MLVRSSAGPRRHQSAFTMAHARDGALRISWPGCPSMKPHPFLRRVEEAELCLPYGFVKKVAPGVIEATGPEAALGELCEIECAAARGNSLGKVLAEVTAVDERRIVLVPLEQ